MNTALKQLLKLLDRHQATLSIDPDLELQELLLSLPEQRDETGKIVTYATTYRLGAQCPPPPPPPAPLLHR